ncbi:MAG: hypothetical protein MZU97_26555 [Bacillus subtilis]|nr:hypothetical protein [Bacillus subtilis]
MRRVSLEILETFYEQTETRPRVEPADIEQSRASASSAAARDGIQRHHRQPARRPLRRLA